MKEKDLNLNKKTMHLTFMELQWQYKTATRILLDFTRKVALRNPFKNCDKYLIFNLIC